MHHMEILDRLVKVCFTSLDDSLKHSLPILIILLVRFLSKCLFDASLNEGDQSLFVLQICC